MPTVTLLSTLGWFSTASLVVASIMRPPCPDLEERPQSLIHDQEQAVMAHDFWGKSGIDYPSELEEMPCAILDERSPSNLINDNHPIIDYRLLDDLETQIELQEILNPPRYVYNDKDSSFEITDLWHLPTFPMDHQSHGKKPALVSKDDGSQIYQDGKSTHKSDTLLRDLLTTETKPNQHRQDECSFAKTAGLSEIEKMVKIKVEPSEITDVPSSRFSSKGAFKHPQSVFSSSQKENQNGENSDKKINQLSNLNPVEFRKTNGDYGKKRKHEVVNSKISTYGPVNKFSCSETDSCLTGQENPRIKIKQKESETIEPSGSNRFSRFKEQPNILEEYKYNRAVDHKSSQFITLESSDFFLLTQDLIDNVNSILGNSIPIFKDIQYRIIGRMLDCYRFFTNLDRKIRNLGGQQPPHFIFQRTNYRDKMNKKVNFDFGIGVNYKVKLNISDELQRKMTIMNFPSHVYFTRPEFWGKSICPLDVHRIHQNFCNYFQEILYGGNKLQPIFTPNNKHNSPPVLSSYSEFQRILIESLSQWKDQDYLLNIGVQILMLWFDSGGGKRLMNFNTSNEFLDNFTERIRSNYQEISKGIRFKKNNLN